MTTPSFAGWISRDGAGFDPRFDAPMLDRLMFVGDPLADAAVAALHEQAYERRGDKLAAVRALAAGGEARAEEFVAATARRPDWVNPGLLAHGRLPTLAFLRESRIALTHSLFAGALFARAALVTQATGRLGSSPATRIRETGAFVAAILEPGGLAPGAAGWETTLRVRLLHASIRRWMGASPGFSENYVGVPIDQTMLAMTLSLFSFLFLRSLERLGVRLDPLDRRAHHHLWRVVGWLLGIEERLLTRDLEEERALWTSLVAHQTFPKSFGPGYFGEAVEVMTRLAGRGPELAPFVRDLTLHLSGPDWFGLPAAPSERRDPRLAALTAAAALRSAAWRWAPGARARMAARGAQAFAASAALAREHDFGVRLEGRDGAAAAREWAEIAAGVRARFRGLL